MVSYVDLLPLCVRCKIEGFDTNLSRRQKTNYNNIKALLLLFIETVEL